MVFFSSYEHNLLLSICIFLLAGITDILDGYIARKYQLITQWGTVLDPLADKLMLLTVLSCLVVASYLPLWVILIVLSKDAFMIVAGILLYRKGTIIPSNIFGKLSTIFFYFSIFIFTFDEPSGKILIYLAVLFTLVALINYSLFYMKNHKGTLKINKKAGS
jgi:cardiolipin synthase